MHYAVHVTGMRTSLPLPKHDFIRSRMSRVRSLQATIKKDAPISGQIIREIRFRTRFDAAVVNIRRDGKPLEGQLGRAELRSGDEVLMSAGSTFDSTSADAAANLTDVHFVSAPYKQFMMPMVVPAVCSCATHMCLGNLQIVRRAVLVCFGGHAVERKSCVTFPVLHACASDDGVAMRFAPMTMHGTVTGPC